MSPDFLFCMAYQLLESAGLKDRPCIADKGPREDARGKEGILTHPKGFTLIELMIVIVIIAIIAAIAIPALLASQRASNERNASASLKTVATAEADFHANDRDGDKLQNFWVGDVAGLYCIPTGTTTVPNKLIEISIASADIDDDGSLYASDITSFATIGPKAGYWYQVLISDASSGTAVAYGSAGGSGGGATGNNFNNSAFGFLAFPDVFPNSGKVAFIINENNTQFKRQMTATLKPASGPGNKVGNADYDTWPTDTDLKTHWAKMD